jgi:hypothetical protein
MRVGRRWGAYHAAFAAAAFAVGIALLILWLGHRSDQKIERLAAEGQLAQGRLSDGFDDDAVMFSVNGAEYQTSFMSDGSGGSDALFQSERVVIPRLGPEAHLQVVYLPSDPSVARLRDEMTKSDAAVYGTAGVFGLIGLVFGFVAMFVLRRRRF